MTGRNQGGLSLVEVVIALGVCSTGILLLMGLLPVGLQTQENARQNIQLAQLAAAVCADLQSTNSAAEFSPLYGLKVPKPGDAPVATSAVADENGRALPESQAASAKYRIQVWLTPPPQSRGKSATQTRVAIKTPAPENASATAEYEVFTALDRNP